MVLAPDFCHCTSAPSSWSFSFCFAKFLFRWLIFFSCSDLCFGITLFRYIVHEFSHLVLHFFEINLFLAKPV